jgi:hypothetical protein
MGVDWNSLVVNLGAITSRCVGVQSSLATVELDGAALRTVLALCKGAPFLTSPHATFAKGVPATATSAATMIMNPWTSAVPPMSVPLLRLLALSQSLGGAGFPYFRS